MNIRSFTPSLSHEGETDPRRAPYPGGVGEHWIEDRGVRSFAAQGTGTIRCLVGKCWVTRTGDSCDYLLSAGEEWVVTGKERLLVQALGATVIEVSGALVRDDAGHAARAGHGWPSLGQWLGTWSLRVRG